MVNKEGINVNSKKKQGIWPIHFNLQMTVILLVCCSTLVSLLVSAFLIRNFIMKTNYETVSEKMSSTAKIIAKSETVRNGLLYGDKQQFVQQFTRDITNDAKLDFIVVMDKKGVRLSHTDASYIGQPFSNKPDMQRVLAGHEFFSKKNGVLGKGYRYFVPVTFHNKVICAVCVGSTTQRIEMQIINAQKKILFALCVGLIVGIIGAIFLARKIKGILLGLEPEEIATQLIEKEIIENEVNEGILAISQNREVILMNKEAKKLLTSSNLETTSLIGSQVDENLYDVLFKKAFEEKQIIRNQAMYLNGVEVIASASPIFNKNQFFGVVATLNDQSEVIKLLDELGGTEQYINSLRAQTHEFLNKLHVVSGLIDLKKFDEVSSFIKQLNQHYRADVGIITKQIKVPAIAGFLLGKINEAKEQDVEMIIASDSYIPEIEVDDSIHALLQVLGNLLDNAKEATLCNKSSRTVWIHLTFEEESQIFILTVCDNGIGITDETKHKLFQVGVSTKGKNRGFGLAIVKKIINQHNGMIEFSAREEGGTTVYLELPKEGKNN